MESLLGAGVEKGAVHAEWGGWLAREFSWDWFATLTFAPLEGAQSPGAVGHDRVGWDLSDRRYREWIEQLAERVPLGDVWWVRAREPHQFYESTHFHALIGGVGKLRRWDAWSEWFGRNGQARIEPVASVEAAGLYVAKYVTKRRDGEVTFSGNLGLHRRV